MAVLSFNDNKVDVQMKRIKLVKQLIGKMEDNLDNNMSIRLSRRFKYKESKW